MTNAEQVVSGQTTSNCGGVEKAGREIQKNLGDGWLTDNNGTDRGRRQRQGHFRQ